MTAQQESGAARLRAQRQILEAFTRIGAACLVGLAMLRASVSLTVFPGWDMDPISMASPMVGLGPTATLAIDCALMTLAGALIALSSPLVGRFPLVELTLFLGGAAAAAWHGLISQHASQEHFLIGMSWTGAMAVAISLAHAARLESVRKTGAAIALGFLAALAFKGAMQVWIETPETIETYKASRNAILASHGWGPDSFAARTFERRLYDSAATGWFGLSNVVATFGAAGVGVFSVLLKREPGRGPRTLATIGLAVSALCVWLAASKGGWAAAGVGVAVGFGGVLLARRSRLTGAMLLLALPLVTVGAVAARGVVGERIGELSLLFRSQYMAAAVKIFTRNPIEGVGPAGFKDAYLLAKSPLSPEEVSSPHSLLLEFAAALGIGGLAWGVLWLTLVAMAGANLARCGDADKDDTADARDSFRPAAIGLAGATIGSAWLESVIATPLGGAARIAGLAIGLMIAWRICSAGGRSLRVALVAAGAACGFHAMIEVTPVQSGSAALFAALIGLAAAPMGDPAAQAGRGVMARAIPGLFVALLGIGSSFLVGRVQRWEWALLAGAERLEPITSLKQELGAAPDAAKLRSASEQLTRLLGTPVDATSESVQRALIEATRKAGALAYEDLITAIAADPTSQPTRQAASNLSLQLAALNRELGTPDQRRLRSAADLAEDATRLPWHRASAEAWLATVRRGIWEMTHEPAALEGAFIATVNAAALDPNNPMHAATAARLARKLGNGQATKEWSTRALRLDENMRLDPLRRFEAAERLELEGLSKALP